MTQRQRDREIVKAMTEIQNLLAEFGVRLCGYDPGVTGFFADKPVGSQVAIGASGHGWGGEPFALNRQEWAWLKPLLEELRGYRAKKKR